MENKNIKILIVEDDQFLREFYQELLMAEGYSIDVAADGEIALQKIWNLDFDLILLDIMLPKKSGVDILHEMKTHPAKSQNIKVVILTNLGQDSVIKECFSLGAVGYLIKSALNPDQVLVEIKSHLTPKS